MRIAHISVIPAFSVGIFKKIEDKAKISKEHNLGIDFYLLNPSKSIHNDDLHVIKILNEVIPTKFLKIFAFRIFKIRNIKKSIPLDKYDAIILRYPLMDGFGTIKFSKKYGHKIFTEHHTDEVSELFANGRVVDIYRAYLEKYFASKFLSNIKGVIGVTEEITKLELAKTNKKLCATTIANGINPNSFKTTGFVPFNGKELILIFIASEFSSWHGLEKLLRLLAIYENSVFITLKLIGHLSPSQEEMIENIKKVNVKIEIIGNIYGKELDKHMQNANLAVSSLALSKKNMKEACTLKSREYIVRRIPFIYAYKDTDLKGNECFAKRFEENNISLEAIIKFAIFVTKNQLQVEQEMKKYTNIVSWKNKLTQMKKFVKSNLDSINATNYYENNI